MKYINRTIEKQIGTHLKAQKVLALVGSRRVGKTVLIKKIIRELQEPCLLLNGEDIAVSEMLARRSVQNYRAIIGNKKVLIIDEAQQINDLGIILKLMVDEIPGIKILISGSSSSILLDKISAPLTGRMKTMYLFPFSECELSKVESTIEKHDNLLRRLVYGNYPELIHLKDNSEKQDYLRELVNSHLFKDLLTFENIRNTSKIFNLLRLIAFQAGGEVSYQELARQLSIGKNTVERYLDLLSKIFILYKVNGYSRNLRKEISKSSKWYFYDNGIRNAVIANFNPLELRNDTGQLWENYIISERLKQQKYRHITVNNFFWRTYDRQEIDWIEERNGKLYAYEFKWREKKAKIPPAWKKAYPDSEFKTIQRENYLEWICA